MRTLDATWFPSLVLMAALLLAGVAESGCIEQTPLNLSGGDVCGGSGDVDVDVDVDVGGDSGPDSVTKPDTDPGTDAGMGCQGDCDPGWICLPEIGECIPEDCTDDQGGFVASFADGVLLVKVNAALGTIGQTGFSWDEVKDLEVLDARYKATEGAIGDLSGIQCLQALRTLWLSGHAGGQPQAFVMNIAPLAALTELTHLDLENAGVENVAPLTSLASLRYLDLEQNGLGDDVAGMLANTAFAGNLLYLGLDANGLHQLPDLSGYKSLRILGIAYNEIQDLSSLAGAGFEGELVILHAEENRIGGVADSGIQSLAGLEGYFAALPGPIPDDLASYVQDWRNKLVIYTNSLKSLGGIETMAALQILAASDNKIGALDQLEGLAHLEQLLVSSNEIIELPPDLESWAVIPPLRQLDISWNPLANHGAVGHFAALEELNLTATDLPNMDFMNAWQLLPQVPPIQWLEISTNPFAWSTNGLPMNGLATVGATLEVLYANEIFWTQPPATLDVDWLPAADLVAIEEVHLVFNGLVGSNLQTFDTAQAGAWDTLLKLYLSGNQIQQGLGLLVGLAQKDNPLFHLDLSGNPVAACQSGDEDWFAKCELEAGIPFFIAPATCANCQ